MEKYRKFIWWFLLTIPVIIWIFLIASYVTHDYQWNNKYLYAWDLGVKQSTLAGKSQYISEFTDTIKEHRADFAEYNAIFLKTPNNSFEKNLEALNTLCIRMKEIQEMDPTSFQYNTAIEQITRQEQDEAIDMIMVFKGCWFLKHCIYLWRWVTGVVVVFSILMFTVVGAVGFYHYIEGIKK